MLPYTHTEYTSKANLDESAFPKPQFQRLFFPPPEELIFHSMLLNKSKPTFSNGIRKIQR